MEAKETLKQILLTRFNLSEAQWNECLLEHKETGAPLVAIIARKGPVSENDLLSALSKHLEIPCVKIKPEEIDSGILKSIPAKLATHYNFMPLKIEGEALRIAVNDPFDLCLLDEIGLFSGYQIRASLAGKKDIQEAIKNFYGVGAETLEAISKQAPLPAVEADAAAKTKGKDIQDETIDPSVIKFLNQVLLDAIKQRATDIHFEPYEDDLRIRYRIDGVLYEVACPPTIKHFQSSIASRIKVMASLDIAEKRKPQDGRIDISMEDEIYDLRVSVMPTAFGESIGIRILRRSSPVIGLESLGLDSGGLNTLEKALAKPYGIILVTGPTGSGKTTTLYACLNKISSTQRKILTIEDPIEYQLSGVTQMQVEPRTGFTFANALRSMLRHDPDIMMVGEIRDIETAEIAVRTALTGHLVLSTLHTNDASSAITRLLDMGIDAFLISSSVIMIIAQRLVRVICPQCKEKYTPEPSLIKQFSAHARHHPENALFRGRGCAACRFTGYKGRTAIFEMLSVSDPIRELILQKAPAHQIRQKAVSAGMNPLRASGWEKIAQGATTMEEVLRVTYEEEP